MIEELLGIETIKAFIDNRISTLPRVRDLKVNVGILFISTFNSRYAVAIAIGGYLQEV